jgi:hypothetical protein
MCTFQPITDQREGRRVVDEADRFLAVRGGAEHVHRAAGLDGAGRLLLAVDPVDRGGVVLHLGLGQGAPDDQVPVLLELLPLLRGHGSGRCLVI